MQHDAEKLLVDVLTAAKDIQDFVRGISFDEYQQGKIVKAAVERKFEIIGEALSRLSRESPNMASSIGELSKIISFRNLIIHGYDTVSVPIVWDIIQHKLTPLIEDASRLLQCGQGTSESG